jgi:hypothetical protein
MGRFGFQSKPDATTLPELPTITIWIRFVLATMFGISLGLRNETRGFFGIAYGLNIIAFAPMMWLTTWLNADIYSYKSLKFAGVPNGFALMLLIWITLFTMNHQEEEESLAMVVTNVAEMAPSMPETIIGEVPLLVGDEF